MPKFRKKPIVIEAEQWFPGVEIEGVDSSVANRLANSIQGNQAWVATLEGGHIVSPGDWIIIGVEGEKYPCKDSIFKLTYDLVDE